MDHQVVDLAVVCMQQNGAAFSAGIVNRMIARFENRWSVDNRTARYRGGNDLQTDSGGHGCSLALAGGSTTELSATDAWHMAVVGDSDNLHLSTSGVCIELLGLSPRNSSVFFGLFGKLKPMDCCAHGPKFRS